MNIEMKEVGHREVLVVLNFLVNKLVDDETMALLLLQGGFLIQLIHT